MDSNELIQLIEDAGYEAQSYSGRGMYGKECVGVDVDDDTEFAVDVMATAEPEDKETVRALLKASSVDQLGKGYIVYFPRLAWEEN